MLVLTLFFDACSNSSLLPSLPEEAHYINTIINIVARTTSTSTSKTKIAELFVEEDHLKIDRNMRLSEPLDINMDDVFVIALSHMKVDHITEPSQK